MVFVRTLVSALLLATVKGIPFPFPYPYPFPDPQCCAPGPSCSNPCPPMMMPPPPPPAPCCMPAPTCMNPCQPGQMPPNQPIVFAPYPGEITFKLMQKWNPEYLDSMTAAFQILEGNVRRAIQTVLGPMTTVNNVYFREGYVPGNPTARPKVVVHCMVNGGSDAASLLEMAVTPDGTLGDGLKVYKDSFNAY
ncbi:uncharacterized protein LOC135696193 [Rhopilema esculentum]|uniref:uncharacterized protein LOC135696193 n=1 Tax=Rhopilema esculentum TaxID=499914 RepID=UPI0031E1CC3C|eukprot:gene12180-2797_t